MCAHTKARHLYDSLWAAPDWGWAMVQATSPWTVAEEAGRAGAQHPVEDGNWGTSQGRESQSRRLMHQHNQWVGFFLLFNSQQQLGSDINNLIRNLENWLGLSGRRSNRKEGRVLFCMSPCVYWSLLLTAMHWKIREELISLNEKKKFWLKFI